MVMTIVMSLIMVSINTYRVTSRNVQRVGDIKAMQSALKLYYRDWGIYPSAVTAGQALASSTTTYLNSWPSNPAPRNDGSCPNSDYAYQQVNGGASFSIQFCLSATTADAGSGTNYAIPDAFSNCIANCILPCDSDSNGTADDGCGGTCSNISTCATGFTCVSDHCSKNY